METTLWGATWPGPTLMPCLKSTWIHKVLSCFLRVHLNVCLNCETLLWCLLALSPNICSLGDLLKGIASVFCITCFLRTYLASFKIWKAYVKSDVKSLMRPVVQIKQSGKKEPYASYSYSFKGLGSWCLFMFCDSQALTPLTLLPISQCINNCTKQFRALSYTCLILLGHCVSFMITWLCYKFNT